MKDKNYDDAYLARFMIFFRTIKQQSYTLLRPEPGDILVDVGCGTGEDALNLASSGATVYGVDFDPELIAIAQKQASEANVPVSFLCSEANAIPLPTGTVDKMRYDRIFQHLPNHLATLAEAHRLLKDGGMIQLIDSDYLSLTFFMADIALERKIVDMVAYKRLPNSYKVRRLPHALEEAGFAVLAMQVHNYLIDEFSFANYAIHFDEMMKDAFEQGSLTASEYDRWQFQRSQPKGKFYMSINLLLIMAQKRSSHD